MFSAGCADLGAGNAAAPAATPADPCEIADENIRRVPADTPSIAQAVTEVGDLGRIIVAAGTYRENIEIPRDVHIVIAGEETARPELLADDPAKPVISVAPDARVCLDGLAIRGSRSGLVAGAIATEEPSRAVSLKDVHVTDAEYGVYGLSERLSIKSSAITGNVYGLTVGGSVTLTETTIFDNLIGALLSGTDFLNCGQAATYAIGTVAYIDNVDISDNDQAGLAICGVATAIIKNTRVHNNAYTGVQIQYTQDFAITGLQVAATRKLQGKLGDGLTVKHSSGIVEKSQFWLNERANILYEGDCQGTIRNNLIMFAVFAIAFEPLDGKVVTAVVEDNNFLYKNQENRVAYGGSLGTSSPPSIPTL